MGIADGGLHCFFMCEVNGELGMGEFNRFRF